MAYNPFNIFRRNQKAIFAVLTVFIMFMFTLSSGVVGGDFFETFSNWLGAKGKRGEAVCTLDGSRVYDRDLTQLRYGRVMANRYMSMAARQTAFTLDQMARDQATRLSPEAAKIMASVRQSEMLLERFGRDPQAAPFLGQFVQGMQADLHQIIDSPTMKPEDKEVARAKLASLTLQSAAMGDHYFLSAPNRTSSDLVSFMLWQKKADQLGIRYTTDDVAKLVRRELYDYLPEDVQRIVQGELRKSLPNFSMSACLKALGEEFRVREAQVIVLGSDAHGGRTDKTYGPFPLFATPYETFQYYRDQCSPTTYAAVPVPAENLMAEVDRRLASGVLPQPTDNELSELFKQYQSDVPNPGREAPGFKTPTQIRLEWLKITGEEPYYLKEAEKKLKEDVLKADLRAVIEAPVLGALPIPALVANAKAFAVDPLTTQAYDEKVRRHNAELWSRYGSPSLAAGLLDTSVVRPGNLAGAAGGMGGQFLGFGSPLAGAAITVAGPVAYEVRDRVKAGAPAVLGLIPGPGLFNTAMGGAAAYQANLPKPLPMDYYRGELVKDLTAERAKELAREDERKFVEEVNKLTDGGKNRDKAPAQKYIAEFVAKRGLTIRGNKTPLSEWALEDDPEMAPLVAAQREAVRSSGNPHQSAYIPFARSFFWQQGARQSPKTGTYAPEEYPPSAAQKEFLVWRAAEVPAAPVNFIAAKETVRTAWKRIKARELAKARAEAAANAIRAGGKTAEPLLTQEVLEQAARLRDEFAADPKAAGRTKPFAILGVCPLTAIAVNPTSQGISEFGPLPARTGPYHPFQLPPSENLKYPSADFEKAIMDERTKPAGTVLVLADAPKDTYFVVTLLKRDEKTENDYKTEVANPDFDRMTGGQMVVSSFKNESARKTVNSVIGLLKQEFKYVVTDEQKKRLEENEKRGGGEE